MRRLIDNASNHDGKIYLALYELDDQELVDLLIANKNSLEIILSNSSADRDTHEWDKRNAPARARLKEARVKVQNRLFNNRHIGHNKFAVYVDGSGKPAAVLTGSTNWPSFGLCAQTNNSVILENPDVAGAYLRYWQRLNEDVIDDPEPQSAPGGSNVQSRDLRQANQHREHLCPSGATAGLSLRNPSARVARCGVERQRTLGRRSPPPRL